MTPRRTITLLLVVSLLAMTGSLSWAALSDIADNAHRVAIERMVELGVLEGRGDGRFWPLDNLNRAEAAKVAAYLSGFTTADAEQARHWQSFDDVYVGMGAHEWAVGWINLVAKEGIILGYGDGKYHPGDGLQMVQWATILIRLLGREQPGLAWPDGYSNLAHGLGLTAGLSFQHNALVNRGEMARFTATAVDDVERADGTRILDTLLAMQEGEDPGGQAIYVSAQITPEFVPAGGGQTVSITLAVNDSTGAPIDGADVGLFASASGGDRRAQLSETQSVTDAAGQVTVTYTTLAADDLRQVEINIHVQADEAVAERRLEIMAANEAAKITGLVTDPLTGAPMSQVSINYWHTGLDRTVGLTHTDAQGRYASIVPLGDYDVWLDLPHRDMLAVKVTAPGATYTLDYDKGVLRGLTTGLSAGAQIYAIPPWHDKNDRNNSTLIGEVAADGSFTIYLRPGTYNLVVVGRSSHFTTVTIEKGKVTDIGTVTP